MHHVRSFCAADAGLIPPQRNVHGREQPAVSDVAFPYCGGFHHPHDDAPMLGLYPCCSVCTRLLSPAIYHHHRSLTPGIPGPRARRCPTARSGPLRPSTYNLGRRVLEVNEGPCCAPVPWRWLARTGRCPAQAQPPHAGAMSRPPYVTRLGGSGARPDELTLYPSHCAPTHPLHGLQTPCARWLAQPTAKRILETV